MVAAEFATTRSSLPSELKSAAASDFAPALAAYDLRPPNKVFTSATARISGKVVTLAPAASVALATKGNVPACAGAPLITPPGESASPSGREPESTDQVMGGVPPDAVRACE